MSARGVGRLELSAMGLGCNFGDRVDDAGAAAVVGAALDAGINWFDTADSYGRSEEQLGLGLRGRRDEAIVATKFGRLRGGESGGGRPERVLAAAERSLQRLGTDRIDLYQYHTPDPEVPVEDTLGALHQLVDEGKVLEIGCSNFDVGRLDEALAASAGRGWPAFASMQVHWSLLHRNEEATTVAACRRHGLGVLPYFPLASGMLTGKYHRGEPLPPDSRMGKLPERAPPFVNERNFDLLDQLDAFCAARGHTVLELALSWLTAQDAATSVIVGAISPEQVRANVAASQWELTAEELAEVDELTGSVDPSPSPASTRRR